MPNTYLNTSWTSRIILWWSLTQIAKNKWATSNNLID